MKRISVLVLFGVMVILVSACAGASPTPTPVPPTATQPAPTATQPAATPTPLATAEVSPTAEANLETLLNQALDAVKAGDLETAKNALQAALTATTDSTQRAQIEDILEDLEKGELEEVEEHLDALVSKTQPDWTAFLHEAQEALEAGDLDKAKEELTQALAQAPDETTKAQIEDIRDDVEKGNLDEAKEHLQALVANPPSTGGKLALTGEAREGYEIYLQVGCAQCHGERGEGGFGPPLAGHTREAIIRQVRNPVGNMPAFPPDRLSDEDLEKIVAFIQALGPGEAHVHAAEELTTWQAHLLMALLSLEDEAVDDAIHHVQHAMDAVEDAKTKEALERILQLLQANELHEAEHELQHLIGEAVPEKQISVKQLHLQLAESAVENGDVQEARHQLQHFIELATGEEKTQAEEALKAIEAGDLKAAAETLRELKGNHH